MKNINYSIILLLSLILIFVQFINHDLNAQCDTSITSSYFKNADFEQYHLCPTALAQLNVVTDWNGATGSTTDYFHTCGFTGENDGVDTRPLTPYPIGSSVDGTGAIGFACTSNYVEYVAQCIKQPLKPDTNYTLKLSVAIVKGDDVSEYDGELILLGKKDCPTQIIQTVGDLENNFGFELIGESDIEMRYDDGWKKVSINFTPKEEYLYVAIGLRSSTLDLKDPGQSIIAYTLLDGLILTKACEEEECIAKIEEINEICVNEKVSLTAEPLGGVWSGNGVSKDGEFIATDAGIGTHQIIYTAKENCADTIEIEVVDIPEIRLFVYQEGCMKVSLSFDTPTSLSDCIWDLGDGATIKECKNIKYTYKKTDCCYTVTFKAKANGCLIEEKIPVKIDECELIIEIPNIITPNNDGINDVLVPIKIKNVKKLHFEIYNRWGNKIFASDKLNIDWNGKTLTGLFVTDGVYYWVMNYVDYAGKSFIGNGFVVVSK